MLTLPAKWYNMHSKKGDRGEKQRMNPKQRAGEAAAVMAENGMIIGLGTGSTAYWAILELGRRVREDGLKIRGVPTSEQSAKLAEELGIPLASLGGVGRIDLTIDGADEVDPDLHLIKGGGGALFREKMVALVSDRLVIAADESKLVRRLGAFRVPVEIVPFGWETTRKRVEGLGGEVKLRETADKDRPFVTDNGNWILDVDFGLITHPAELHESLKRQTGVVETGLFPGMADTVVVGGGDGVRFLDN